MAGAPDFTVIYVLSQIPDGFFTADAAGRAKFVAGFVTRGKIAAGVAVFTLLTRCGSTGGPEGSAARAQGTTSFGAVGIGVGVATFDVSNGVWASAESDVQVTLDRPCVITSFGVNVPANSLGGGAVATLTLRRNGADTPLSVIVAGTGVQSATGGAVAFAAGDKICISGVVTAGTGALNFGGIQVYGVEN